MTMTPAGEKISQNRNEERLCGAPRVRFANQVVTVASIKQLRLLQKILFKCSVRDEDYIDFTNAPLASTIPDYFMNNENPTLNYKRISQV
jgi:hypothetical protein